jgi:hypothetical protein
MHGTPSTTEQWKPILGFESVYEVSSEGRVKSLTRRVVNHRNGGTRIIRGRIITLQPDGGGYLIAHLYKGGRRRAIHVASLVTGAFIGPKPEGLEVRHFDGVKTNNNAQNLLYGTRVENMGDARRHDTWARGERQGQSRLTEKKVLAIRASKKPSIILSIEFGISYGHVRAIKTGVAWAWLNNGK